MHGIHHVAVVLCHPLVQLLAVLLTGEVLAVVTAGLQDLVQPLVCRFHSMVREFDQGLASDPILVLESQLVRNSRYCLREIKARRLSPEKQSDQGGCVDSLEKWT